MATRPDDRFLCVRTGIGTMLRTFYSDTLNEPIPQEMIELLQQLDEAGRRGQDFDKA